MASSPSTHRSPRRDTPATLRVHVELADSDPPIWRRLDLRSDLHLDEVHHVLQATFAWTDSHLHCFALGESILDDEAERFLCPFDVEDGEEDDGVPAYQVRLDETLAAPGDLLRYCYDYGDNWELTLRLEEVLPEGDWSGPAVCVAGERAAPPEDCGSRRTESALAEVLDDPAHFVPAEVDGELGEPHNRLLGRGFDARLIEVLMQLRDTPLCVVLTLDLSRRRPIQVDRRTALAPMLWFLGRVGRDGLPLTDAGWLKPVDVLAAADVVPGGPRWIGTKNREIDTVPVRVFRRMLHDVGLVRKYKGHLRLTRAGAAAYDDPDRLWAHLTRALPTGAARSVDRLAELLALAHFATSADELPRGPIAAALMDFGWQRHDGGPIEGWQVLDLVQTVRDTLLAVDPQPSRGLAVAPMSAAARELAFDALHGRP